MKRIVLLIMSMAFPLFLSAQTKAVYIEAFGASNTVGVNFDTRFKGNSGFGIRAGIGYGIGNDASSGFFWGVGQTAQGVSIPVEINWLLGKKKSHLELGFGMSNGIYRVRTKYGSGFSISDSGEYELRPGVDKLSMQWGYYLFGNIGYRFQPAKGFTFRVGLNPSFTFGNANGVLKSLFYPYLSIGYAF